MKPTDLPLLTGVSAPTIHPDGTWAVVSTSRPNLDSDSYVGQLWSVPTDGSAPPRRITRGTSDSRPRFSPDGALLAFVRKPSDAAPQLFVMPATGGEPVQVTDRTLGVGEYHYSPDSSSIAFASRVPDPGRYGSVDDLGPGSEPPRRITTLRYTSNGLGYTIDRRSHLFLVGIPDVGGEPTYRPAPSAAEPKPAPPQVCPESRQLTEGDFDYGSFSFSPDGSTITAVSAQHDTRDDDLASGIVRIALDAASPGASSTGASSTSTASTSAATVAIRFDDVASIDSVAYAPDGSLYLIGADLGPTARDFVGRNPALYLLTPDLELSRLTDPKVHDLGDTSITVVGDAALVQHQTRGRVELLSVDREGTVTTLVGGDVGVTGHASAAGVTVATFGGPGTHGDVGRVDGGSIHPLTDFSDALRRAGVIDLVELVVDARDGYPVHGWVLTPAGDGPHPVLLTIHGGPFAQYGVSLFDEAQVYADAGYAVVMCNPRGSAGYGEEHGRAIRQKMGSVDFTDVQDFLDGALARHPFLDSARVGIMGGSYGGYLTAWTIAHDHRFAAAIVERGFLDPDGFVGTSDIGTFFGDEYVGTDPELMRSQSPQAVVDQVTTPTLVIHSAEDLRCPLSQGERYYAALKRNGVEAELLIFPGENHELTRGGTPRHRLQRFDAVLDWWTRHLPVGAPADDDAATADV